MRMVLSQTLEQCWDHIELPASGGLCRVECIGFASERVYEARRSRRRRASKIVCFGADARCQGCGPDTQQLATANHCGFQLVSIHTYLNGRMSKRLLPSPWTHGF